MISLIIASKDPVRYAAAEATYRAAFGAEPWELIGIHDAQSLAEAFTRGVAQAKGEILVFSHDDAELLSPFFPQRLKGHLAKFDLIGVAGTTRLTNSRWVTAGHPYIFGQICHPQPDGSMTLDVFGVPRPAVGGIQGLDGVFFAARRTVFEKVSFDAVTFDGFHLYDLDFSFAAYRAGLRLAVANDINLLHHSAGAYDQSWATYAKRFDAKWRGQLSPIVPTQHKWAAVAVRSKEHALELMNPPFWRDQVRG
jgi:glycosyl transferase family 2